MTNNVGAAKVKLVLVFCLFWALCQLHAQEQVPIDDMEIKVSSFQEMLYPAMPLVTHIQGMVIVKVKFDTDGKVITASGVSGDRRLMSDALANAKKWTFEPNKNRSAIIIYEFKLVEGTCKSASTNHIFVFRNPNVASVIGCKEQWQP